MRRCSGSKASISAASPGEQCCLQSHAGSVQPGNHPHGRWASLPSARMVAKKTYRNNDVADEAPSLLADGLARGQTARW